MRLPALRPNLEHRRLQAGILGLKYAFAQFIMRAMSEQTNPQAKHLDIRKYPNRRYYDTTRSRHLTLDEIRSLIREGYDLRVTDSKAGVDITAQVLTQIILELETQKLDSFPVPLLTRLIRVNDQLVKDFIEKYFNQALKSFLDYQQQVEEQIRRTHGLPSVFPSVSAWTKAMLEPFASALSGRPLNSQEEAPSTPEFAKSTGQQQTIRDLEAELAELKRSQARRKGAKRPSKRR